MFRKWWPAVYADEWLRPSGMKCPFAWGLVTLYANLGQGCEEWTWGWVETLVSPTIAEVEDLIRADLQEIERAKAAARGSAGGPSEPQS